MNVYRPLHLLIAAAAIASAPLPTLAQTWPATVVAVAPRMTTPSRVPALTIHRDVAVLRPAGVPPTQPDHRGLKLNAANADPDDIPEVEIRAKAEWTDDQGLRVGPTRLAYKSRF
jgi:hypothetical protein